MRQSSALRCSIWCRLNLPSALAAAPRYSGVSIFSNKIKCGDCGGWYSSKIWHSTDRYRKVIYRCNHKYNGEKCGMPHVTEEEVKARSYPPTISY